MPTRLDGRAKPPGRKAPSNSQGWTDLMRQVMSRAEILKDKRLEGLRLSLSKGQSEKVLRGMSIICAADIDREFPPPPT